jgi:hypothetical protein
VHGSYVFITLELASSGKQMPQFVKTLETRIVDRAIREDAGSLQAGRHRRAASHVENLQAPNPRLQLGKSGGGDVLEPIALLRNWQTFNQVLLSLCSYCALILSSAFIGVSS